MGHQYYRGLYAARCYASANRGIVERNSLFFLVLLLESIFTSAGELRGHHV